MHIADGKIVIILDENEAKQVAMSLRYAVLCKQQSYGGAISIGYRTSIDSEQVLRIANMIVDHSCPLGGDDVFKASH